MINIQNFERDVRILVGSMFTSVIGRILNPHDITVPVNLMDQLTLWFYLQGRQRKSYGMFSYELFSIK